MAKGNLPNTNTQATSNSIGLNNQQSTGNQAPWQQMANSGVSYPMGLVKQGPLGPFGTVNTPLNMPSQQLPEQQRQFGGSPFSHAMPRSQGLNVGGGLSPSPDLVNDVMPRMIG